MIDGKNYFKEYLIKVISDPSFNSQIKDIINSFQIKHLKKNEFFVREGAICNYFCFIESGILQHSITISGEEKTTYLALKNSCTSALKSFLKKVPSRKNIKALSSCKLYVIDINSFDRLLKNNAGFYTFYHNLIENQIFLIDDYRIDLLTLSPEDRYKKLLANEPTLLQQVPLHYLSSFLGISNRHMSRIRSEIK